MAGSGEFDPAVTVKACELIIEFSKHPHTPHFCHQEETLPTSGRFFMNRGQTASKNSLKELYVEELEDLELSSMPDGERWWRPFA